MAEKYRPSNGCDGDAFMSKFCHQCARANLEEGKGPPCEILGRMLGWGIDDPQYPVEMITDEKGPRCTAFIPEGQEIPYRCPDSPDMLSAPKPGVVLPEGKFAAIHADAAWLFKAGTKGRPQHYKRMTLDEIKAMPVKDTAAPDCWLFFWTTGPHLEQAFEVLKAWGFKYSGMGFTWVKMNKTAGGLFFHKADIFMGQGYTTRKNAEFCLLAKRGKPKRLSKRVHEIILSPRREHSRKPDEVFERIEQFAAGPYLELFSREARKGWTAWGDEAGKFN